MHPNRKKRHASAPDDSPDALPGSDQAIEQAFIARRAQRLAAVPEPTFPASGSAMVAARLAQAKARETAARRA